MPARSPLPVAVLISGGGTTLLNLLRKIEAGQLDVRVVLVLSSTPRAGGLEFARERGIPTDVVRPRDHAETGSFGDAVFGACRAAGAELVVMGGFLAYVPIPADFENRVTNIHPGLIPAFCGQGYYGMRVHQAVIDYGAKVSGCTIHFVDNVYDHGPIILQRVVEVADDETPESLQEKVFALECEAYPEALQYIAERRVTVEGRRVHIGDAPV